MTYNLCNGHAVFDLTKENQEILDFLVKYNEEADKFIQILMESVNENIAVSDYRLHRIEQRNMSLEEFENTCSSVGVVLALQELVMHPIKKLEIELLTNKINGGKITVREIFERHKSEKRAKLLRLLL